MDGRLKAIDYAGRHWFFMAFAAVIAGSYGFARSSVFVAEGGEMAILIDLCLTAPLLYCWCYWNRLPHGQLAIRAAALAGLGVWIAGVLIPSADQTILPHLNWARTFGIAVLALIELRVLVALVRLSFSGKTSAEELAARANVPPAIARLMLMEARFWRWVWKLVRRR